MLESSLRPLTAAERRLLGRWIRDLESGLRRGPNVLIPGGVVLVVLWVLPLVLSDSSWLSVTAFWIVVGAGILLWVRRPPNTRSRFQSTYRCSAAS
jgi:hypothetical protein